MTGTCVIGGVQSKFEHDTILYSINWQDFLNTGLSRTTAAMDKIDSSIWVYAADSPQTDAVISGGGFDETSGQTWFTLEGGTAGGVYYVNNMIVTKGAIFNGAQTPPQTAVRQVRIRVASC